MPVSQGLKNSLNKIREISSEIYHQYIPVIDDDTDIGTLAQPLFNVPEVYNEFCSALINRIVYTQVDTLRDFKNPLKDLEGSIMPLGYAGQEIHINPAKGRRYNADDFAGILQKYEADVKVQYLVKNMDIQYPVTIIRTKLKEAFVSWESLDRFINGLSQSLYNGMYIDEFRYTKSLVSSAYKNNNVIVDVITDPSSSESVAKEFIRKSRQYFLDFQLPSTDFNAWKQVGGAGRPITTWTLPEDIVLLLRNDIRAYVDVNVLADAYQIGKADFLARNIYPIDNFDVYSDDGEKIFDGSSIYAMIADRNWFKIKPIDQFMEDQRNANNRSYQLYLNNIKMYEYSLFANAIVFASKVSDVAITGLSYGNTSIVNVKTGATQNLEVVVTPFNANTPNITYKSSNGDVFTVAADPQDNHKCVITAKNTAGVAILTAKAGNVKTHITVNVTA